MLAPKANWRADSSSANTPPWCSQSRRFNICAASLSCQQFNAAGRAGVYRDVATAIFARRDLQAQVGQRQQRAGPFGPFDELEPGFGEHLAQTSIDPFARVVEAVEIQVRGPQSRQLVGLQQRIGRALDAA